MENALDQMLETWRTNHRINLFLIDHTSDEGMRSTLSKRGGRNVTRQFTHLHNVRLWQLANRRAKDLADGLVKFETKDEPNKEDLKAHLTASADAIEVFIKDCAAGTGNRRGFRKGVIPFIGYLVAHESHHRGNILLTLKVSCLP